MKIIHRYILFSVAGSFLVTLLVLTGILCLGNLLKVADLILRGMNPTLILKFFGFLIVDLLQYAIPTAILTATTLVFGRLSADNEITGMRACGIGLKQIIQPVIFLSLFLILVCLYLQTTAIPSYGFATRKMKAEIGLQDPDALLQPGKTISLPGYTISFERKEDGFLHRIQINRYEGEALVSTIFGKKAAIELDRGEESFNLKMLDGTVEDIIDRDNPQIRATTTFGTLNYPISLEKLYESARVTEEDKRKKDMTSAELLRLRRRLQEGMRAAGQELSRAQEEIGQLQNNLGEQARAISGLIVPEITLAGPQEFLLDTGRDDRPEWSMVRLRPTANPPTAQVLSLEILPPKFNRFLETAGELVRARSRAARLVQEQTHLRSEICRCDTEFQLRFALSAACLAMVFISIPLAIQAHRGEKTIGMALSLVLLFFFYIFIAYADAVAGEPDKFPYLIVWVPNLLFSAFGGFWLVKFTRI